MLSKRRFAEEQQEQVRRQREAGKAEIERLWAAVEQARCAMEGLEDGSAEKVAGDAAIARTERLIREKERALPSGGFCPHCERSLSEANVRTIWAQRSAARRKIRSGGKGEGRPRLCPWRCGKTFKTDDALYEHLQSCRPAGVTLSESEIS